MQLVNTFLIPADFDTAWTALQDVDLIAPCMPGATLNSVDGDRFEGAVKVKLGPVAMTYGGEARFATVDHENGILIIEGVGRDSRGAGTASGTAQVSLRPESEATTRAEVVTEFTVTGKAAQFGRGVMQDVAGRIAEQFAANLAMALEQRADAGGGASGAGEASGTSPSVPVETARPLQGSDSIDLLGTAGAPVLKRAVPLVIAAVVALGIIVWWSRR